MRKIVTAAALAATAILGLAAPAQAAKPAPAATYTLPAYEPGSRTIRSDLYYPSICGTDVQWVQRYIGAAKMGEATGCTSALFTAGVKWFQSGHGIYPSGAVYRDTWTAMGVTPTY